MVPENQATLRSLLRVGEDVEVDAFARYVDRLSDREIDAYLELDLRLGWRLASDVELSLLGSNLLDSSHQEFFQGLTTPASTRLRRSVFGKVVWTF
jgi:iron complex outermembrane receptor protein